ncbi:MAG: hypothetical protein H0W64_01545 [Gammaproteobacteria bacterium]|nr:hypothetical protein [Gammaproteobacteria bacterium]
MRLTCILTLCSCLLGIGILNASPTRQFIVPFQNFTLNPKATIQAAYTIGQHGLIFCFLNNTMTGGIITWPYQGARGLSSLPIYLKTQPRFEGSFADNSGIITITNNQSKAMVISCLFGF